MARKTQVMVFNLAETVREFLVSHLPEPANSGGSLWESMQRRQRLEAEEVDSPSSSYAQWFDSVDIGLFGDDPEDAPTDAKPGGPSLLQVNLWGLA